VESHLGGHRNTTWVDEGTLAFLIDRFKISSMVDVGCGPAGMKKIAESLDVKWLGIDGDPSVKQEGLLTHDFTRGAVFDLEGFDLGWSVEFLEHVYEKYQSNYMYVFSRCKFVVCTAAPPGWGGHHHVNCQPHDYWIRVFAQHGFAYNKDITTQIKNHSTMKKRMDDKNFMEMTGMFFQKE
jgi:hypothetical protein